jgi:divalent metal cation (Fe/Co/Zn/Cd) transporter
MAALLIMQLGVQRTLAGAEGIAAGTGAPAIHVGAPAVAVLAGATLTKACLYLLCSRMRDQSSTALSLAADHRNDGLSNSVAILGACVGFYAPPFWWWADPCGAILIALYILVSWISVAKGHMDHIVGKSAPVELLQEFADIVYEHKPPRGVSELACRQLADCGGMHLDVVRAYHFGRKFLVEMEVVMPAEMRLRDSHDIAMGLQQRLEQVRKAEGGRRKVGGGS